MRIRSRTVIKLQKVEKMDKVIRDIIGQSVVAIKFQKAELATFGLQLEYRTRWSRRVTWLEILEERN